MMIMADDVKSSDLQEIDYIEFERHGAAGSMSSHYFDLVIHLKTVQEHQFRNIQRNEYHNLFNFISSKNLKIINLAETQAATGVAAALEGSDDEGVDPHLNRIRSARESGAAGDGEDSDEEDEDFVAEKDDAGSPTDDSEEEPDASDNGEDEERPAKKEKRPKGTAPKPMVKKSKKDDGEDGDKKKKRKKKDPNAPKRALSGFMYFSQAERENLKKSNPGMSFPDMAKTLGERWKRMSGEEKEPYEAKARVDKERYKEQMAGYRSGIHPGDPEDDSDED